MNHIVLAKDVVIFSGIRKCTKRKLGHRSGDK